MSNLIRTKQGEFNIDDCYTLEEIEAGNYKLLSNEEVLSNLETIDIEENQVIPVNNGAIINKSFKNEIACLRNNNKIIAIYKTYEKDNSLAKPYIMLK